MYETRVAQETNGYWSVVSSLFVFYQRKFNSVLKTKILNIFFKNHLRHHSSSLHLPSYLNIFNDDFKERK